MNASQSTSERAAIDYDARPKLDDGYHVRTQATAWIEADPAAFFDWYMHLPIETFMKGGIIVPAVAGVETMATPEWGMPGSARYVDFVNRTGASEAIITNDLPRRFEYQVWDFVGPVKLMARYGLASMEAQEVAADGSRFRLVWDYAFKPLNAATVPLLLALIKVDWGPYMQRGIETIAAHVDAHGPQGLVGEASSKAA